MLQVVATAALASEGKTLALSGGRPALLSKVAEKPLPEEELALH